MLIVISYLVYSWKLDGTMFRVISYPGLFMKVGLNYAQSNIPPGLVIKVGWNYAQSNILPWFSH